MLKDKNYYQEKANQLYKDTVTATKEVKRLLNTISLEDIQLIEHKSNTQNKHSYNITLTDDKMYYTGKMNKEAWIIFLKILPLNKHERLEEPIITKGLLQNIENQDKVFKSFK